MNVNSKIVVTGSAGLVGQNLIIELKNSGYKNIVAIDKHHENIQILRKLHSDIEIIEADLSEIGEWEKSFENAEVVIILHAQIGAKTIDPFIKNNITATEKVLETVKNYNINYIIHVSSSVVNSKANDFYTTTKKAQEKLVLESGINYTVLRPTLMFGWFDRKHLGWLSRFMEKVPFFPIPGHGKYIRQPLYERDFAKIIVSLLQKQEINKTFNITFN